MATSQRSRDPHLRDILDEILPDLYDPDYRLTAKIRQAVVKDLSARFEDPLLDSPDHQPPLSGIPPSGTFEDGDLMSIYCGMIP